jgi:flagellar motor switch protein FliG
MTSTTTTTTGSPLPRATASGVARSDPPHPMPPPRSERAGGSAGTAVRKAAILLVSLDQADASALLDQLDRGALEAVSAEMARLDAIDPEEQAAILDEFALLVESRLQFGIDDLPRLGEADLRMAYHDQDAPTWALAMAGAPRPVQTAVLRGLPARSATALRVLIDNLGPFRLDDAEAAQGEIMERIRRLHDLGRIGLPAPARREVARG